MRATVLILSLAIVVPVGAAGSSQPPRRRKFRTARSRRDTGRPSIARSPRPRRRVRPSPAGSRGGRRWSTAIATCAAGTATGSGPRAACSWTTAWCTSRTTGVINPRPAADHGAERPNPARSRYERRRSGAPGWRSRRATAYAWATTVRWTRAAGPSTGSTRHAGREHPVPDRTGAGRTDRSVRCMRTIGALPKLPSAPSATTATHRRDTALDRIATEHRGTSVRRQAASTLTSLRGAHGVGHGRATASVGEEHGRATVR